MRTIRLTKCNAAPTRITKDHLEIWTSPNNYRYHRAKVAPGFSQAVEKSAARSPQSERADSRPAKGDPVRVLTLSDLNLRAKYMLVTTNFRDGPGDFTNAGTALLTALDEQGREIPGVFATGGAIWLAKMVDFRNGGLMFDHGWAAKPSRSMSQRLRTEGFHRVYRGKKQVSPRRTVRNRAQGSGVLAIVPGGDDRRGSGWRRFPRGEPQYPHRLSRRVWFQSRGAPAVSGAGRNLEENVAQRAG